MPLTFVPGSGNGTELCAPIITNPDDLIECDENFTVILALTTLGTSINVGNNISVITLLDIEGILWLSLFLQLHVDNSFDFLAASFAVPNSAITLVENEPSVMMCVTMTVTPATATLNKEVVLTLSAVEGTGIGQQASDFKWQSIKSYCSKR